MKQSTLILYTFVLLFFTLWNKADAQIAVIVNKSNSVSDLSLDDLKNIYLGKVTSFPNKKRIVLSEYASLKKKFHKVVLNKTTVAVQKYWIGYVFSGKSASPPTEFKYIDEVKSFVSRNPGAISFVDVTAIDESVKVLTIDSKKTVDTNYPLK